MYKGVGTLAAGCIGHGQSGIIGTDQCCSGLTKWIYDAKNGRAYPNGTFVCWNASCAPQGSWAGPSGSGNYCCSGLVNNNGICSNPQPAVTTYPLPTDQYMPPVSLGFGGISSTYLLLGGALLIGLMMLKRGKR